MKATEHCTSNTASRARRRESVSTSVSCLGWSQLLLHWMITVYCLDHRFYCIGWSQLFTPLDDHNCLLSWMITTLYCLGWSQLFTALITTFYCPGRLQLFTALDDHICLLPWMIATLYCLGWSQLFTALDDYNCLLPWVITTSLLSWMITDVYCLGWLQLFTALDDHSCLLHCMTTTVYVLDDHSYSCYCLGRLQLFSTLDDQSCLLIIFLTLVNLLQLVHKSTVSELTHAKISHLVQREYIFLTACSKEGWRAKIIPGPIKVSLQWRCLYAWMSHGHLAPQLTHETVRPYEEVRYQTHQHSRSGSQTCGPPVHLTQASRSCSKYSMWPSSVQAFFFNLNCFLWWAVRLIKDFDIAGQYNTTLSQQREDLITLTDNEFAIKATIYA